MKFTKTEEKSINKFQTKCLRKIFEIRWQQHILHETFIEIEDAENVSGDVDGRLRGKGTGAVQKTTWRRMVEVERNNAGWNSWNAAGRTVQTGINGKTMSKPYVPSSTE